MRILNKFLAVIGAIFFLGLAGYSTTVALVEEGSEYAVLSGKQNKFGGLNWQQMSIYKVNAKRVPINDGAPIQLYGYKAHISPGAHQVEVRAEYNEGGWPSIAFGTVTLQAKANREYHPVIKVEENIVTLWLIDAESDEIVSNISEPYDSKGRALIVPL